MLIFFFVVGNRDITNQWRGKKINSFGEIGIRLLENVKDIREAGGRKREKEDERSKRDG